LEKNVIFNGFLFLLFIYFFREHTHTDKISYRYYL
jgi:hypothetical protein